MAKVCAPKEPCARLNGKVPCKISVPLSQMVNDALFSTTVKGVQIFQLQTPHLVLSTGITVPHKLIDKNGKFGELEAWQIDLQVNGLREAVSD